MKERSSLIQPSYLNQSNYLLNNTLNQSTISRAPAEVEKENDKLMFELK